MYRIAKAGSIKNLKLIEEEIPTLKENEVSIEVHSIGLNFADIFAITGLYSATPKESFIPGLEFSGKIIQTGKSVKKWKSGEKVMGVTRFGAYSTHLNVDEKYIRKLPKNWDYFEGSAFLTQSLTAYYALLPLGNLKKGDTVLIHSAAGGVGIFANRIAKKFGVYTIGTIGDESKSDFLKSEGYDDIIVRDKHFSENIRNAVGKRKLNLVLDSIGGSIFQKSYEALSPTGRIVTYGSANFTPKRSRPNYLAVIKNYFLRPKIDPLQIISENKSVLGFNLIWLWEEIDTLGNLLNEVQNLKLEPQYIGKIFPFKETINALNYFQSGKSIGKIVLSVD